ncbi:hypothetical protein BCR34DRAFT_346800 [Clohesyomyces aquaticus]|uniref:Conserved oligomeric Golgi complex subunit 1 n=1 Tax=Clohesyomyces aquaticus TaxID=1231657 RepID=A0A1Y1ZJZ4_9PLEO|nr:hypothetical protein BCR34DRAFT_346800 [Clohesyomyces aquaticus]
MATEAPDPRTFKSWEDAFQFPIPVVRKLEKQLRSNAGENREKLRSLVGASYRDLLDTAETIIDMELRMEQVEAKLARVGQNCNSRGVDRILGNAAGLGTQLRSRDMDRYTFASQLSVFRSCPTAMSRLMRGDAPCLLIAKVLVISRLLYKALSQAKKGNSFADHTWNRLGSLRRKLLLRINKQLASAASDTSVLVEAMCAYSLATSSTPTDVLRHFHHVRLEEAVHLLQTSQDLAANGVTALRLCLKTCQDTSTIFPRRLAESLAKLKTQPLAQDPDVRALYELNLDIHDRWIGDEARNYTPQPRHDELQRTEAEKLLSQWSKQAIFAFQEGTKAALSQTTDLKAVASLRRDLIETWILSGSRMPGLQPAQVLDDLRDTMNAQLKHIVRSRAQTLRTVVLELTSVLQEWSTSGNDQIISLWETSSTPGGLSDGAQGFKTSILNTYQRRDEAVLRVVSAFDRWTDSILEVKVIVKNMKETRWDDTFAEDVDDSDDEFGLDSKESLLSEDDPALLEETTQEALRDSLHNLRKSFAQIISQLTSDVEVSDLPQVTFLLRAVREIADRIPTLRLQDKSAVLSSPFTPELLAPLHAALAKQAIDRSMKSYSKALKSRTSGVKGHILWEGNPPLPAQPSPSAFRLLQQLVKDMAAYGSDVWAPEGVQILKSLAIEEISKLWKQALDTSNHGVKGPPKPSSDTGEELPAEDQKEDQAAMATELIGERLKQLVFDMLYLQRYLGVRGGSDSLASLDSLVKVASDASLLDDSMMVRLRKNVSEYWRKTYLMFALLS